MILNNHIRKFMINTIKTKFVDYEKGPAQKLFLNERQLQPLPDHHLMKVKAIGLNRAQVLHRLGRYAINNDIEKYIGLEASGQVIDPNTNQKLFDGIALLSGGSYAEWAWIPKTHVIPLPPSMNYIQGACIPEAWLTAYQIISLAELKKGDKVVIYAGASGVGTAAIQICNVLGYEPYAVVSVEAKGELCKKVGVKEVVCYKDNENWDDELIKANDGKLFNAVLDCVATSNVEKTIKLLDKEGSWILYGLLSGNKAQINFGSLLFKRIRLITTTLKTRSKEYKDNLIQNFKKDIVPQFGTGKCNPIISQKLQCDWKSVDAFIQGHNKMQNNVNAGKIIIEYK